MAASDKQRPLISGDADFQYTKEDAESSDGGGKITRKTRSALRRAAHLNNLMPTGTILAFQILCPFLSINGLCDTIHRCLIAALLGFCALWAFLLSFTDSVKALDGRLFFGIATLRGLCVFGGGNATAGLDTSIYRMRFADFCHGFLSMMAVVSLGLANSDVAECLYPRLPAFHKTVVPGAAAFVISFLFVMFPSGRRGIGHPVLLSHESATDCY